MDSEYLSNNKNIPNFVSGGNMRSLTRGFARKCAVALFFLTGLLCSSINLLKAEELGTPTSTCWVINSLARDPALIGSTWSDPTSALDAAMQFWLQLDLGRQCQVENRPVGTVTQYQYLDVPLDAKTVNGIRVPTMYIRYVDFYCSTGGTFAGVSAGIVVDGEYYAGFPQCQQNYIVKLSPSVGSAESETTITSVEPEKITDYMVAKVYDKNGRLIPNTNVKLELSAEENSGGHHHNDNRPEGVISNGATTDDTITGNTAADGLVFTFIAPKPAGDYKITATCTDGKNCKPEGPNTVWVGVKDLEPLSDSGGVYQLVGQTTLHPDNHYLTSTALSRVTVFAAFYHAKYPNNAVLYLNDASLERGGVFDLSLDWKSPHFEHCRGTVIDIRANGAEGALNIASPTDPMINKLKASAAVVGADAVWEVPKRKDLSTGKLVDEWDTRHFHTKLMGQEGLQCP